METLLHAQPDQDWPRLGLLQPKTEAMSDSDDPSIHPSITHHGLIHSTPQDGLIHPTPQDGLIHSTPELKMPSEGSKVKKRKAKNVVESQNRRREERDEEDLDEDDGEGDEETVLAKYDLFDKLVAFFEDRPYFYDVSDGHYNNRKRKDAELADFARSINWTPAAVLKRWRNWRTDYGKIRRWESGQGARRMSVLQQWKLRALAFMDPYILRRGSGIEMGRAEQDEVTGQTGDLSSDEEAEPQARPAIQRGNSSDISQTRSQSVSPVLPTSSTISGKRKLMEKKRPKKELGDILSEFLSENREKDKELVSKCDKKYQQSSERDTFAAWLGSVVQQVPASHFRTFQKEIFGLCHRYLEQVQPEEAT